MTEFAEILKDLLVVLIFSSARMTALLLVVPFFGEQFIVGLGRNVVILSLTLIVVPLTIATLPADYTMLDMIAIIIKELIIGLVIGYIIGIVFYVAEGVGSFIDTERGSSMSEIFDPMSGGNTTTLGALMMKFITIIFFVTGGFLAFMGTFYYSYKLWPIFSFYPTLPDVFPLFILEVADYLMRNIVLLSAPVAIVLFLAEFGLGMMNRFAPQLNVFSLSMPVKSGLAMFMFLIYLSVLYTLFRMQFVSVQELLKTFQYLVS